MINIFITLFFGGFIYGLFRGNKKMFWLWRSLSAGTFFALFFISIPTLLLIEHLRDKKEEKVSFLKGNI